MPFIFFLLQSKYSLSITAFYNLLGTAIMLFGVFAISDKPHRSLPLAAKASLLGVLVFAIGVCFGVNTGYAINPARDFGPRILTAFIGFHPFRGNWWWEVIIAPLVGATLGSYSYKVFIG